MNTKTQRPTGARYEGSLTDCHGEVLAIDDCTCERCILLDAFDEYRAAKIIVRTDAGQLVRLDHAGWQHIGPFARRDTAYGCALAS